METSTGRSSRGTPLSSAPKRSTTTTFSMGTPEVLVTVMVNVQVWGVPTGMGSGPSRLLSTVGGWTMWASRLTIWAVKAKREGVAMRTDSTTVTMPATKKAFEGLGTLSTSAAGRLPRNGCVLPFKADRFGLCADVSAASRAGSNRSPSHLMPLPPVYQSCYRPTPPLTFFYLASLFSFLFLLLEAIGRATAPPPSGSAPHGRETNRAGPVAVVPTLFYNRLRQRALVTRRPAARPAWFRPCGATFL